MARFKIISKDGSSVKYEGKLRYIGSYLKPSYVEFSEISSPTHINWEIGDYVDYSRTGMRYRLFSVPQVVKNARAGSHGSAFSYTNVQFFAATKELEIALFRDLVSGDNNIHFSTSPDVATFEDVAGIARRIQACMDDLYPGKWVIKVADFDAESDAEVIEKITTAKDFALSGGTCLDALSKIYELWQDIGWIHSYDPTREKDIITIGYTNKRIDANTTDAFLYGKGNGLTAIKKSQANKEEFATRLYVYGSERNLPSRYYNDKDILNAESVDIRNLMLPMDVWGRTDGKPDARKAYIENAEAVAKIGVIPRVHYFDSDESGADIYPSIEGMTVGMLRKVLSDMGDTAYSPSYEIYADASERVDEVGGVISLPTDEGKISEAIELTTISIPSFSKTKSTGIVESVDLIENHILYEGLIKSSFEMGEITVKPSFECTVTNADFSSVLATLTLDDSLGASTSSPSKTISIPAEYDESRNLWVLPLKDISVKFDRKTNSNGFYIYLYVTISATKNNPGVGSEAIASILGGNADIEVKQILSKTFNIRLKQIGFNLNLQADLGQGKTISMKTGKCAGRNFVISSARYSPSSDSWDITCKRQQDETLGLLFPNTNYEIQAGDRFILLDIAMPESYIRVAMERLLAEGQKLFNQVSTVRSNYEPSIDAKLMAESGRHLREGMFMEISDSDIVDNTTEHILIDTLSIYEDESAIPTYKVTLRERRKVTYKGTPSAAATTKTSSVEDGETDMSEYAKTAYVDKKDKEFSSTLSKILDWFTLEDGVLLTKYNLASEKEVSAKGINASQGGGTSYNRLDSWSAYDSSKAGYVLSALLGYDLHSRVTTLENAEVDLSDYYTKSQTNSQIASAIGAIDLSPYATKEALSTLEGQHNTLRSEFDALNNLLSSDTTDYINTWNEVVAFLDGYKDESDLATILSGMNADISSRLLTSTFESWKADTYTPLANLVANHTTRLNGLDQSILSINTRIDGVDKTIEDHIAEFTAFRANFEISDNLILVRKNFASTEEVSAKGINQGTGGGGGSSYSRLDTWEGYDNNKAGYVLSAGLGYGLKVAIDELEGYNLDSRVSAIENSYVSKDAGGVVNGGLMVSSLAIAGGSSSQFLKADGSLDSTSYLPTSGGTIESTITTPLTILTTTEYSTIRLHSTAGYRTFGMNGSGDLFVSDMNGWNKEYIIVNLGNIGDYAITPSTIGSQSVAYASNAGSVAWGNVSGKPSVAIQQDVNNFIHNSNEFTFVPNEYNDVLWLNYRTTGGTNGNIVSYIFGNGKGGKLAEISNGQFSGNATSATKLATARTIWGQSFDGTGNVSGDLHLSVSDIYWHSDKANYCIESVVSPDAAPSLKIAHYGGIGFHTGGVSRMYISYSGNVGIGTADPAYKLDVIGDIRATESITIGGATLSWENGALKVNTSFYSEKEISAKGLSTGGGSGASYNRLDAWGDYDSSKAGYVLSAGLGYDLKLAVDELNGYNLNSRLATVESNYLSKNGGVATNLTVYGGTINGDFIIDRSISTILYYKDGVRLGLMGFRDELEPIIYDAAGHYSYDILHTGNVGDYAITPSTIGSQSVAYASNAGTLAGISLSNGSQTPWGTIPMITETGYMDVGRHFEFHYDNSTGSDYSTILMCTGNYGNFVYLPSASGTLALTTDNVASATKLATPRTIWGQSFDGTKNIDGDFKCGYIDIQYSDEINRYGGNLYLQHRGGVGTTGSGTGGTATGNILMCANGGNVAIGTADPQYKLHVDGTGYFSDALTANGGLTVNGILTVGGASIHPTANNPYFQLYQNNNYWYWQADNSNTYIGGTMSKALRIDQNGNVLVIGTLGADGQITANNGLSVSKGLSASDGIVSDWITAANITANTSASIAALTVSGNATIGGDLSANGDVVSEYGYATTCYGFRVSYNNRQWSGLFTQDRITPSGNANNIWLHVEQGAAIIYGDMGVQLAAATTISSSLSVSGILTANGGLTVSGLSTLTGGIATNDIHGNGQSLYLGNASNNAYIKVRENMQGSTSMWSIPRDGKAVFTSLKSNTSLEVVGDATMNNVTINAVATAKKLVVGIDGMSCNAPATFNDFIYGSSITPKTDNYYVLGNNNYKWYGVTAYNVNVHEAITIEAGKELRFKDDNGVVHTLKYDSTKQAFVFDGNVNATGEMSAKKLNA